MKNLAESLGQVPREILVGVGQTLLQPSPYVGAAFLAGAFLNSPWLTLFGLVGCLSSVLIALICHYPEQERFDGLYGFNGTLAGLAVGYFYDTQLQLLGLVIPGAMVTSIIMHQMLRQGWKPFTAPYVVVSWFIVLILLVSNWVSPSPWSQPETTSIDLLESLSRGFGQPLFQENIFTGLIIICAITVRDWVQGIYAIAATFIGMACGYLAGFPIDAVNLGLFGYNGVLCAILFAGKTIQEFIWALAAIFLSIIFMRIFHIIEVPPFTFPFVLSAWLIIWAHGKF